MEQDEKLSTPEAKKPSGEQSQEESRLTKQDALDVLASACRIVQDKGITIAYVVVGGSTVLVIPDTVLTKENTFLYQKNADNGTQE